MESWWFTHASGLSRGLLVVAFIGAAAWETVRPRRVLLVQTARRWMLNGLSMLSSWVVTSLVFRVSAVVAATAASGSQYGLLNRSSLPFAFRAILAFLLLDLVQYADHYLRHAVPALAHHRASFGSNSLFDRRAISSRRNPVHENVYLLAIAAAPVSVVLFEACNLVQAFSATPTSGTARVRPGATPGPGDAAASQDHHSREADQRANLGVCFLRTACFARIDCAQFGRPTNRIREVSSADSMRPWTHARPAVRPVADPPSHQSCRFPPAPSTHEQVRRRVRRRRRRDSRASSPCHESAGNGANTSRRRAALEHDGRSGERSMDTLVGTTSKSAETRRRSR
jgi:hypothetical protein